MTDNKTAHDRGREYAERHTPGPWHCNPEADLHKIGVYAADARVDPGKGPRDDIIICDVTDEDLERDRFEFEANARLIAAAPDLLAACENLVLAVKEPVEHSMGHDQPPEYATAEDHELARVIFEVRAAIAKARGTA